MSQTQSFFPKLSKKNTNVSLFEKTPTYYKSLHAQARIRAMNPDVKLITIGSQFNFSNSGIWEQFYGQYNMKFSL